MVDGDPVKPRAPGRFAAKRLEVLVSPEENVMRGVLSLLWVAKHAQAKVVNWLAMLGVDLGKRSRPHLYRRHIRLSGRIFHRFAHKRIHQQLDNTRNRTSRQASSKAEGRR